jgi:predicted  nucleic acid-binding Zn-ribbon protein
LKEIEDLAASLSAIEDRMIACLEEIDEKETTLNEKKDELQNILRDIESEKDHIRQSVDSLKQRLDGLAEARSHVITATDPELLKLYEIVKNNIGSTAIALVKSAVCMECHVNLPPQMFNELLRFNKVFYCPHCERLIYPLSDSTDSSSTEESE